MTFGKYVIGKKNFEKKFIFPFFVGILSTTDEKKPDPCQHVTDPQNCIRVLYDKVTELP
jgi:hypothetical protein